MIYLHHPDGVQIAVCEDDRNVAWYEARGFVRCTLDAFRVAWQRRDMQRRMELAEEDARAVGQVTQTVKNSTNSWRGGT